MIFAVLTGSFEEQETCKNCFKKRASRPQSNRFKTSTLIFCEALIRGKSQLTLSSCPKIVLWDELASTGFVILAFAG